MPKKGAKQVKNSNKHSKYGQAAMEYLMTYGWAILVVLTIIAILAFVVRPQPIETCQVQTPFECVSGAYVLTADTSTLIISVKNNGWEQIQLLQTSCGLNDTGGYIDPTPANWTTGKAYNLSVGQTYNLKFNCTMSPKLDPYAKVGQDVFQTDVYVTYNPRSSDTSINKTTSIRIAAKYG
jgi:hypothetical protein